MNGSCPFFLSRNNFPRPFNNCSYNIQTRTKLHWGVARCFSHIVWQQYTVAHIICHSICRYYRCTTNTWRSPLRYEWMSASGIQQIFFSTSVRLKQSCVPVCLVHIADVIPKYIQFKFPTRNQIEYRKCFLHTISKPTENPVFCSNSLYIYGKNV